MGGAVRGRPHPFLQPLMPRAGAGWSQRFLSHQHYLLQAAGRIACWGFWDHWKRAECKTRAPQDQQERGWKGAWETSGGWGGAVVKDKAEVTSQGRETKTLG